MWKIDCEVVRGIRGHIEETATVTWPEQVMTWTKAEAKKTEWRCILEGEPTKFVDEL